MNYFCVAINKEILDNKVFLNKEDAITYFKERFGEDIDNEIMEKEQKIRRTMERYDKKLENSKEQSEIIDTRRQKKQVELDEIHRIKKSQLYEYVWKFDDYKNMTLEPSKFVLLRICAIYMIGNEKYKVVEEVHKVTTDMVQDVVEQKKVFETLPQALQQAQQMNLYPLQDTDIAKVKKFIIKVRQQALREYNSNLRRKMK